MVYIFEALSHNRLLKSGDQIAIATPISASFLQIPSVKNYNLISVNVSGTEENNCDIPEEVVTLFRSMSSITPVKPVRTVVSDFRPVRP